MIKIGRLIKSFTYAWRGLFKTFHEEQNLQIQTVSGLIATALGLFFRISREEWLALILAIGLVLILEIVNSAIERVTDVLKPRINTYVKEIKDIMAAAVMLASITATIAGLVIFIPRIISLYN
jgi:diacylglycerol kinase